jgi:hypothetical protein
MKLNFIPFTISTAMSLIIAYAFYVFGIKDLKFQYFISGIAFGLSFITLGCTFGVHFNSSRITTNIRTISAVFFVIGILSLVVFKLFFQNVPSLIIFSGILSLIFLLIIYSVNKSGQ